MSGSRTSADQRRAQRAGSFDAVARNYHRYRPGYPERAVRLALPDGGADESARWDVLDLAAGTGKLTDAVLPWCRSVVAVEPLAGMREQLTGRHPSLTVLEGRAEAIPVAAASVDAVLVGQAFHWFEPQAALSEAARVTRPGGVLSLLANEARDTPETHRLWVDIETAKARLDRPVQRRSTDGSTAASPEPTGLPFEHPAFETPVHTVVAWTRSITAAEVLADQHTHSIVLTASAVQRATFDDELRAAVDRHWAHRPADEPVDLPMQCHVWRAVRRS